MGIFLSGTCLWSYPYLFRQCKRIGQYTNNPRIPIAQVYTETIIPLLKDAKDMIYKIRTMDLNPEESVLQLRQVC